MDNVKKVQHCLVDWFPFFQTYLEVRKGERVICINVGGCNTNSKPKKGDGFLVYFSNKKVWTGHLYDKKFTLSTEDLCVLLRDAYEICYITHKDDKVIRSVS